MPQPVVRPGEPPAAELLAGFERIRDQLGIPESFPAEVEAAAAEAVKHAAERTRADRRDLALVTIDPPGSRDLDQAFAIERRSGGGWKVWYAIADIAVFAPPGQPVDTEARQRGVTLYSPDERTPLHPPVLSEGAASLLPEQERPAVLWSIDVEPDGASVAGSARLEPALVRSRGAFDYPAVQAGLDAGTADEPFVLMREVGLARQAQEVARGGASVNLPDQEVERGHDGQYRLSYRRPLPIEGWNAQVSLLAGMEAARIMIDGRIGLLRTLPEPDAHLVAAIKRSAAALGVPWPDGAGYADFVRSVDPAVPAGAALLHQAARALRGAGYLAFDGDVVPDHKHSAVAAAYAHVTAPLRRLADRFANEVVLALCADQPVPPWTREALPHLPKLMGAASQRERKLSRAIVDFVEAMVLQPRVGETFDAVVTAIDEDGAVIQLRDPAVLARLDTKDVDLGAPLKVRLLEADPIGVRLTFGPAH